MNLKNVRLIMIPVLTMCLGSLVRAGIPFKGIVCPTSASKPELLSAKEIRRYVYLRTRSRLPISQGVKVPQSSSNYIVVGRKDRAIIKNALSGTKHLSGSRSLKAEEYLLASASKGDRTLAVVTGGDNFGTLYAAYGFCEKLGVRSSCTAT